MHPRHPILVGVGQLTLRDQTPERHLKPVQAMNRAVQEALDDSACPEIFPAVDAIHVVNILTWQVKNAPAELSASLGISPTLQEYSAPGGHAPQWMVNRVADNIAAGKSNLAIIAGCDMMSLVFKSMRSGKDVGAFSDGIEILMVGNAADGTQPVEVLHGADEPVTIYPLIENALRYKQEFSIEEQRHNLGRYGQNFSAVAAQNPHAWLPISRTAEEVVTPSATNRMIAFPYTKFLNSCPADQAAALIMTCPETATQLGIPESKWAYLHGGQDANDEWFVGHRPDLADSPAIRHMVNDALEQSSRTLDDIHFFDLYSCFPVMPRLACHVLNIPDDDPRPLTVTGGLSYFGGAGNNYTLHAIAETVNRCRAHPDQLGLVTGNGYYSTKHSAGIYGAQVPTTVWQRTDPDTFQERLPLPDPLEVELNPSGPITVDAYTVIFGSNGMPERGVICGRTPHNKRVWANTPPGDTEVLKAMMREEWCGKRGEIVERVKGINIVRFP